MGKTTFVLMIMLGLTTFSATAQQTTTILKRAVPEPVEASSLKQMKERYRQIKSMDLETLDPTQKEEFKEELNEMKEELQRRENRRRRPIVRLLFLAAIVALIIVLV